MKTAVTPQQARRINTAFERMAKAIDGFIYTCAENDSPVKSITVKEDGNAPIIVAVRYAKRSKPEPKPEPDDESA